MPIIDVELVAGTAERQGLAARLADSLAAVLGSGPMGCWVRVRRLAPEHYAENGGGPPEGVRPVFVSVLLAELPEPGTRRVQASAIASEVARVLDLPPQQVHVLYQPAAAGRVAFGGRLLEG
jgi:phenylpyruvate tautomerase PptA (4-oxalocrotonate tautomerase family)